MPVIPQANDQLGVWPQAKWDHAIELLLDLKSRVDGWLDAGHYRAESVISEDRLRFQSFLRIDSPPPVTEWAIRLGDCIHNFRSTLDAAVWELAHRGGGNPVSPWKVQFPFCETEDAWLRTRRGSLAGLPEDLLDRIGRMQPFRHTSDGEMSLLSLLNHLDIDDKHKAGISADLQPTAASSRSLIRFESQEAADRHVRPVQKTHLRMVDGALLHDEPTKDPIVEVVGDFEATIVLTMQTPKGPGIIWDVMNRIVLSASNALSHLYDVDYPAGT